MMLAKWRYPSYNISGDIKIGVDGLALQFTRFIFLLSYLIIIINQWEYIPCLLPLILYCLGLDLGYEI